MADTVIITEDKPKTAKPADVVVVTPAPVVKPEKIVTEKTTVTETIVE